MQVKALKSPYALTPEAARRQLIEVFGAFVESICRCSGGEWGKVLADQWSSLRKQLEPQFNVTGVTRFFQALNRPSSLKLEGLGSCSSIGVGSILSFYPASNSSRGMMALGSPYIVENNNQELDPQQQSDLTSEAMNAFLDPHLTQPSLGQIQQNIEALKQSYGSIGNDNHDCLSSINGVNGNNSDNNCPSMSLESNSNQQQGIQQCETSSAKNNSNSNPETTKQSSSTVVKGTSKKSSSTNKLTINSNQAQSSIELLLSPSEILRRNKKDRNTKIHRALSPQQPRQQTLAKAISPVRKNTKAPYEKNGYFFAEQKHSAPKQSQGILEDKLSSRSNNIQAESQQEDTLFDATILADDVNPVNQLSQPAGSCIAASEAAHDENAINENHEVENGQQVEISEKPVLQEAVKAKTVSEPLKSSSQQQSQGRLKSKGRDVVHFGLKGITSITSSLSKNKLRMIGSADKENNDEDSGCNSKRSFKSFSQYKQSSKNGENQLFGLHSRYNNNHHLSSSSTVQINLSHNRPHNIVTEDAAMAD